MSILEGYVTPREAAKQIGRSYQSVCRYIEDGILPAIEDRGRKYIPAAALKNFEAPPRGNPTFYAQKKK